MFFCQPALVFRLQVQPPANREFEFLFRFFQQYDCIAVIHAFKIRPGDMLQTRQRFFINALREERHIIFALIQHRFEQISQKVFSQCRVVVKIGKRHFGLYHPELSQVTTGVRVFRPKRWSKRIDLTERQCITLGIKLTGDRQVSFTRKKILVEIDLTCIRSWGLQRIQRTDAKQLACTFAIAGGNQWCVHPLETTILEVTVDGTGQGGSHTTDSSKRIGTRPQVRHLSQVFKRMALFGNGVLLGVVNISHHRNGVGLNLDTLPLAL